MWTFTIRKAFPKSTIANSPLGLKLPMEATPAPKRPPPKSDTFELTKKLKSSRDTEALRAIKVEEQKVTNEYHHVKDQVRAKEGADHFRKINDKQKAWTETGGKTQKSEEQEVLLVTQPSFAVGKPRISPVHQVLLGKEDMKAQIIELHNGDSQIHIKDLERPDQRHIFSLRHIHRVIFVRIVFSCPPPPHNVEPTSVFALFDSGTTTTSPPFSSA